jgi:hypothetical protein
LTWKDNGKLSKGTRKNNDFLAFYSTLTKESGTVICLHGWVLWSLEYTFKLPKINILEEFLMFFFTFGRWKFWVRKNFLKHKYYLSIGLSTVKNKFQWVIPLYKTNTATTQFCKQLKENLEKLKFVKQTHFNT